MYSNLVECTRLDQILQSHRQDLHQFGLPFGQDIASGAPPTASSHMIVSLAGESSLNAQPNFYSAKIHSSADYPEVEARLAVLLSFGAFFVIYSFPGHCIQFQGNLVDFLRSRLCEKLYRVLFSRSDLAGEVLGFSDWVHDFYQEFIRSNFFEMRWVKEFGAYF